MVATATSKTATTSAMPEFAQKLREQLLNAVQQSQQLYVDSAATWQEKLRLFRPRASCDSRCPGNSRCLRPLHGPHSM